MRIAIHGRNLPGRRWCNQSGDDYSNIHVGLQVRSEPVDLVAGDAPAATWELDVAVAVSPDGELDFKGPAVHGKRGERFLYLTWGDVGRDGSFAMFRRAKLMLNAVDGDLVPVADANATTLVANVDLTDDRGGPRCARVGSPALAWSLGPSDASAER